MHAAAWLLSSLLLNAPAAVEPGPPPNAPQADAVPVLLAEAGIGYEIDQDGDYRIVYAWEREGRSQLVYVSGHTEEVAGRRIREVFSPAAQFPMPADHAGAGPAGAGHGRVEQAGVAQTGPGHADVGQAGPDHARLDHPGVDQARTDGAGPDPGLAEQLLRDSRSRKLGAWELAGDVLYYVIKLPEPLDAALLRTAVGAAAEIADERERALTGDLDAL